MMYDAANPTNANNLHCTHDSCEIKDIDSWWD